MLCEEMYGAEIMDTNEEGVTAEQLDDCEIVQ
jgi:hypothetical protein